ncbi:MAG: phosphonate C-P lyase system protein PhnH [Rhizobiales bacterium]|nr:phosphonate C-P lyase system protein PhnH [Hyphomicrobiales bacterium]
MTATAAPGFADPVLSAQSVFRAIMDATARPGSIQSIEGVASAPPPLSAGAAAIALTLLDQDTPVWLDACLAAVPECGDWLRFHTGAPIAADASRSAFAFVGSAAQLPQFDTFSLGTPEYPDRSTTLVFQVDGFSVGPPLALSGPGIRGRQVFRAAPLPADFAERLAANRAQFPCGVDVLLVCSNAVAALPRSVHVIAEGG